MRVVKAAQARGAKIVGEPDQIDAADGLSLELLQEAMAEIALRHGWIIDEGILRLATVQERRAGAKRG